MSELDLQHFILSTLNKMSLAQQYRLLVFINSIVAVPDSEKPKGILRFAGVFDAADVQEFKASLRDCE